MGCVPCRHAAADDRELAGRACPAGARGLRARGAAAGAARPDRFPRRDRAVVGMIAAEPWLHRPTAAFAEEWQADLNDFAAELLGKHHRCLRKRLKTVDLDRQEAFHSLRIQTKKMRY